MRFFLISRRVSELGATLRYASGSLVSFLFIFLIIFGAFVQTTYLTFSNFLRDFSTIVRATETMFSVMLGYFDFEEMAQVDRLWAPFILFFFSLIVGFVFINFLIGIILFAFAYVRYRFSANHKASRV